MSTPPAPASSQNYQAAWRSYRLWSRATWILFFLFLPSIDLLYRIELRVHGRSRFVGVAIAMWFVAFYVVSFMHGNFRCPRCGESFFATHRDDRSRWRSRATYSRPWSRKCLHCGLPKWATAPTA